jgi:hypothetical protein
MTLRKSLSFGRTRHSALTAACSALWAVSLPCHGANAADITYYISQNIGVGGVTGDIVTDGTTNGLSSSDIVNWNLFLNDGTDTRELSASNSVVLIRVPAGATPNLSATANQLLFNFSGEGDNNYLIFENTASPTSGYLCFNNVVCSTPIPPPPPAGTGIEEVFASPNQSNGIQFTYRSGTQAIGSTAILPVSVTELGAFEYDFSVAAGDTYFVDPRVAVGYSFSTGAGDPNFASVLLPAVQSDPFDVSFTFDGVAYTDTVAPLTVFDFPTGGVSAFKVTGVDPADGLEPSDTSAFVTGLTFESEGTFTGTQTPVIEGVPETSTWAMMLFGFAGLVILGYRNAHQRGGVRILAPTWDVARWRPSQIPGCFRRV